MKKMIRRVMSLFLVLGMLLGIANFSTTISADDEVVVVTGSDAEVTQRGGNASVTYKFELDPTLDYFSTCKLTLKWDPALMTLDSINNTDFVIIRNEVVPGVMDIRLDYPSVKKQTLTITLNFKDVLKNTTEVEAGVEALFEEYDVGLGLQYEVSGKDVNDRLATEVSVTDATVKYNPPVSIAMNPGNPTSIMKGQSGTFAATVTNDDTPPKGITWSVNSTAGSTIDGNGKLTIAEGESATSLIVTAASVKDPSKKVTATVAVTKKPGLSLTINPTSKKLFKNEGHTVNFTAKAVTTEAGTVIKYSLAGAKHAGTTIDVNTGELTIDKDETANELVVTATAENNATEEKKVTATAKVSLVEISVVVNPTSATVEKGSTQDFKATVTNDLTNEGVTWKLEGNKSDKTTLVDGELTVAEDETATDLKVIATSVKDSTKSATAEVTVVEAPEITITINPLNAEVKQGSTQDFTAVVGNDKKNGGVEWSITGATSKDTKIETNTKAKLLSDSATLTVGEDEKVGTVITVEAISVTDGSKVATAKVVVTAKGEITTPTNPTNPTIPGNPSNPSKAPDKTTGTDVKASPATDVKTGDNTNMGLLVMMLGVSALGIFSVVRKKKVE